MQLHFRTPAELEPSVFDSILRLIRHAGEVNPATVRERLEATPLIGYITVEGNVVATASVKKPLDTDVDNAFVKAHSPYRYGDFPFELGYLVVASSFRRRGFASLLTKGRCERFVEHNLFSTVRCENVSVGKILRAHGFFPTGKPFRNRTDTEDLVLFIKLAATTVQPRP